MGDKITQLPVATTVDGTEIVPIVQGGATKQVTGAILRRPVGAAGGDLTGTYPNPTLAVVTTAQTVGSATQVPVVTVDAKGRVTALTTAANPQGTVTSVVGGTGLTGGTITSTGTLAVSYGTTAGTAAQGNDARLSDSRAPIGAAGGDLAGTYPDPTLAAVTTAQSNIGSGTQIPVISVDAKGRVTALSSVAASAPASAITALTGDVTASGPGSAVSTLATITTAQTNIGSSTTVPIISVDAKGRVTALGSTPVSGSAGGTVTSITAGTGLSGGTITASGTIAIADVTTAQAAVGNSTTIPVITVNAKGQITALTTASIASGVALATTAPANLASTAAVGTGTTAARDDHQHAFPTAANVGALAATAAAGGDLTGNYPSPTLAAITTAQSNVGSSALVPVISVDAKGRVTALSTVSNPQGTVTSVAGGTGLTGGTITGSGTLAVSYGTTAGTAAQGNDSRLSDSRTPTGTAGGDLAGTYPNPTLATVTTAQTAVGNSTTIPVITVNAKGQITALTTATAASGVALATTAPANLASVAAVGVGTTAARADHQHAFPTAANVGALAATAAAGGDLAGNYPNPTLNTVSVAKGGTGQTTYTDGQLLIGNSTGNTLAKAALTAGSNITITNGPGSITIAATNGTAVGGGGIKIFDTAGANQSWTSPAGVSNVKITVIGGGGGSGTAGGSSTCSVGGTTVTATGGGRYNSLTSQAGAGGAVAAVPAIGLGAGTGGAAGGGTTSGGNGSGTSGGYGGGGGTFNDGVGNYIGGGAGFGGGGGGILADTPIGGAGSGYGGTGGGTGSGTGAGVGFGAGASGGGGGGYAVYSIAVTAGTTYTNAITVGAAGGGAGTVGVVIIEW